MTAPITLATADLGGAIALARRCIRRWPSAPGLSGLRLTRTADRLVIAGTDLETMIEVAVPADLNGHAVDLLINAPRGLGASIKAVGESSISVSPPGDGTQTGIRLQAGAFGFALDVLPTDAWAGPGREEKATFSATLLPGAIAAISRCASAMAGDEHRAALQGVLLTHASAAPTLTAVATDGHRIVRAMVPSQDVTGRIRDHQGCTGVIIPAETLKLLLGLAKGREDQPARIEIAGTSSPRIEFRLGETRLLSRLVEEPYPGWQKLWARRPRFKARFDRAGLDRALRVIAAGSTDRLMPVRITLRDGQATLSALWDGGRWDGPGTASATLSCIGTGAVTIGFNHRYVVDLLRTFRGCDRIDLAFASRGEGEGAPDEHVLATSPDDTGVRALLMPLRI